ncbi:hypothetical protein CCP4SC76_1240003 [Gammaproteobacteria bacterium]
MSVQLIELEQQARTLSPDERARLVEALLESLRETSLSNIEAEWPQEIENRVAAYDILVGLPPDKQAEVFDFIRFISSHMPARPERKNPPLREEPAFGLWADREDMRDSTEWVRKLREREWEPQR